MKLVDLTIEKPITTSMIFLGVIILGIISLKKLPQELLPPVNYPQLTIITSYSKASPSEMEKLITKVIEESVGTVGGIKKISSISREGSSLVICDFLWGTNMNFAALETREKIDLVKEKFPRDATEPIVMKYNPFQMPVMILSISQNKEIMNPVELRDFSKKDVKGELERINGIASIEIRGGQKREILVELNQGRLRAMNVSILGVIDALEKSNVTYPAGTIKEKEYEYLIKTEGEFKKISEIKETVVKGRKLKRKRSSSKRLGSRREKEEIKMAFLKDLATVRETVKEPTSVSRYNLKPNISLTIHRQSRANIIDLCDEIREKLIFINKKLPEFIKIEIIYDQSKYIKDAIFGVGSAAIEGGILAFLVLLLFLGEVSSSIIVISSIPVSIMFTFALMYFNKISINIMSLGGMALGIGMLVDNSVVVIENIFRHREKFSQKVASIKGANEVVAPIIASTLTTIVVFLPFIFISDISGQLFRQLALTVIFSLIASLFVALFLVPRYCSTTEFTHKIKTIQFEEKITKFRETFIIFLKKFLKKKERNCGIVFLLLGLSIAILLLFCEKEFMPKLDKRRFFINVTLLPEASLSATDKVTSRIEKILTADPEVRNVSTNIGTDEGEKTELLVESLGQNQARISVDLKKKGLATKKVVKRIKTEIDKANLNIIEISYVTEESIFGFVLSEEAPLQIKIKGKELDEIVKTHWEVRKSLRGIPGLYGIKSSYVLPAPEIKVKIDKNRAGLYNLSVKDITASVFAAIKGFVATEFKKEGEKIDIRVQLRPQDRKTFSQIGDILLYSPLGTVIPLKQVAKIGFSRAPSEIRREDGERVITISANIIGRGLGSIIKDVRKNIEKVKIESDIGVEIAGELTSMKSSFKSLIFVILLAIVFVYMIMASQFESLWQPFIITLCTPLTIIGVVFALLITGTSLNIIVLLGFIILSGIVVNDGIVLVSYINELRNSGVSLETSVIEAARIRLRPIIITTLTTVVGLIPLALGIGKGAELRAPMAIAVMGGLLISTFFTLAIIPCIYLIGDEIGGKKM